MSEPSRVASYAEQEEMNAAARTYMGHALALARKTYGDVFDTWPEDAQHAAAVTTAVQGVMTADAFAVARINLNTTTYAVGLAVGTQTAQVPDEGVPVVLARLVDGFTTGRSEAHFARAAFKTTGSAN